VDPALTAPAAEGASLLSQVDFTKNAAVIERNKRSATAENVGLTAKKTEIADVNVAKHTGPGLAVRHPAMMSAVAQLVARHDLAADLQWVSV